MGKQIPIAVEISSWPPYREIIYKCANCGQDFRMFGDKEIFCHTCGTKVDWKHVMKKLPSSFDKNDYDREKILIAEINKCQLGLKY